MMEEFGGLATLEDRPGPFHQEQFISVPEQAVPVAKDYLTEPSSTGERSPVRKRKSNAAMEVDSGSEGFSEAGKSSRRSSQEKFPKSTKQNHSEVEKRRRDRMNMFITELASIIPMCTAMNRKLDKLTVLRMAVQHMRTLQGDSQMCTEVSSKPSFISDEELKHLILRSAEGFLFVVSCDRGRILYVSESVGQALQYKQAELIGQSLFDYLHPKDIAKVKEQLMSFDFSPRDRYIDAKTMTPVKADLTPSRMCLFSGARRSFYCRMKKSSDGAVGGEAGALGTDDVAGMVESDTSRRRRRAVDRRRFAVLHCTGYIKSWTAANMGLDEELDCDNDTCNLGCLVTVAIPQPHFNSQASNFLQDTGLQAEEGIKVRPIEFISRHTVDGKFTYVDQRVTPILGYLPQELLGTSLFEYYHSDDVAQLTTIHKKASLCQGNVETALYRFKAKDGLYVTLKSRTFGFRSPWTKELEYIVSTNTLIPKKQVTSSSCLESDISTMNLTEEPQVAPPADETADSTPSFRAGRACGSGPSGVSEVGSSAEASTKDPSRSVSGMAATQDRTGSSSENITSGLQLANASWRQKAEMIRAVKKTISASSLLSVPSSNLSHSLLQSVPMGSAPSVDDKRLEASRRGQWGPLSWEPMSGTESESSGTDGNDEASIAMIMSLLEADGGLGESVDFSDLPWPL